MKINFFKNKTDQRLAISTLLILLHVFIGPKFNDVWFIDLWNHFRPFEVICGSILGCILLIRKSWKAALGVSLVLGIGLFAKYKIDAVIDSDPYAVHSDIPFTRIKIPLQVISFNVLTKNERHKDVIEWIESKLSLTKTNLVFLMETNQRWATALSPLKKRLPYSIEIPRENNFGLVLLSDTPLNNVHEVHFEDNRLPAVFGYILEGQIRIAGVHPLPPVGQRGFKSRNQFFENLRKELDKESIPTLVFGDLNSSPWSANINKILLSNKESEDLKLLDSFNGLFRPHTWIGLPLSIPIDYILFTPHFIKRSAEIGPELGSDHLPVITTF